MAGSCCGAPGGNLSLTVEESEPPPPPLDISLTVDPTGTVDPKTGVATISGTVTCSQPTEVQFYGELRQHVGRLAVISGYFSDSQSCDGETRWSATVDGNNGKFAPGSARVRAEAYACTFDSCDFARTEADIRLRSAQS